MTLPRVAFVTSHPIQYQVPVFRHLAERDDMEFEVLFAMLPDAVAQGVGFGVHFEWDLPLLDGYKYSLLNNVSSSPGVTHFRGCDTPDIVDELKRWQIDVVVVNGWVVKTCLQTLAACCRLGIPCIARGEANHLRPRPWWKRLLQKRLVRSYDAVLPIGSANRDFYLSHGVPEARMFAAPYCVDNARFEHASQQALERRDQLRNQRRIPPDAVCFVYCGKLEQKKHPVELIGAFLKASRTVVGNGNSGPMHLLVVGDGELRNKCEFLVSEFGRLNPGEDVPVTFTGFRNQSQIVDDYVAGDVLVLPSDAGETWGLVVNEAMVCGRPAIVSDLVGCAADMITDGRTGWTFPFGDWDALTDVLLKVSRIAGKLPEMATDCRSRAAAHGPDVAANGIARAVKWVMTQRDGDSVKDFSGR